MESITLRSGECSNTGGIQEKFRQPLGRYPLICIPALSRVGLDGPIVYFQLSMILLGSGSMDLVNSDSVQTEEMF